MCVGWFTDITELVYAFFEPSITSDVAVTMTDCISAMAVSVKIPTLCLCKT